MVLKIPRAFNLPIRTYEINFSFWQRKKKLILGHIAPTIIKLKHHFCWNSNGTFSSCYSDISPPPHTHTLISPNASLKESGSALSLENTSFVLFFALFFFRESMCVCVQQTLPFYRIKYLSHLKEIVIMNYESFARSNTKLAPGPVSKVGVNLWQTGYWWMIYRVCSICQHSLRMRVC